MNIYGVVFKKNGKIYYFNGYNLKLEIDHNVIVETEKGFQFGKIVSFIEKNDKIASFGDLKDIVRIATDEDFDNHLQNIKDAEKALQKAISFAKELELEMNFIDAIYTFDRKQLLFNFIADGRIDFRELAKKLAAIYKTRIELRQIGVRDKAKEVGGIGQCGRKLCCSSFLGHIDTVSINMAKNQNIALNPSKINGSCGRLLCCLAYEDDVYSEYQKDLPAIGNQVKVDGKLGIVISVNVLKRSYRVDVNGEIREVKKHD